MKDVRPILLKALIPAIQTATGKSVFTRAPKDTAVYPYIYIANMYMEEEGPKTEYQYRLDVEIQVLYQDVTSLSGLYNDMDDILGIVNNGVPFALDSPYQIMDCRLNTSNIEEFIGDTGTVNVGIVRLFFRIK